MSLKRKTQGQPRILYAGDVQAPNTSARSNWNLEKVAKKLDDEDDKGNVDGKGLLRVSNKYPKLYAIVITAFSSKIKDTEKEVEWLKRWLDEILQPQLRRYGFSTHVNSVASTSPRLGRQNIVNALNQAYAELRSSEKSENPDWKPPLILITFPQNANREDYYPDVKWWGDCIRGVPTMCLTYKSLARFPASCDKEEKELNSLLANIR